MLTTDTRAVAADGDLDTTFDSDGTVTTDMGSLDDYAESVTVQADGKLVVAGRRSNGSDDDFTVARYNADGSLDTSFDSDGKVATAIGGSHDDACCVLIQSDARIVVVGYSHNGSNRDFAVVRYNTDGSLDTTFDTDGKVTTDLGGLDDYAYGGAIEAGGKTIVVGRTWNGSDWEYALARYNSDGSLDTTFDGDGKVVTDVNTAEEIGRSVSLQSDGKIVVAGFGHSGIGTDSDFVVVRYVGAGSTPGELSGTVFRFR